MIDSSASVAPAVRAICSDFTVWIGLKYLLKKDASASRVCMSPPCAGVSPNAWPNWSVDGAYQVKEKYGASCARVIEIGEDPRQEFAAMHKLLRCRRSRM
jgi:hypothetical protein